MISGSRAGRTTERSVGRAPPARRSRVWSRPSAPRLGTTSTSAGPRMLTPRTLSSSARVSPIKRLSPDTGRSSRGITPTAHWFGRRFKRTAGTRIACCPHPTGGSSRWVRWNRSLPPSASVSRTRRHLSRAPCRHPRRPSWRALQPMASLRGCAPWEASDRTRR